MYKIKLCTEKTTKYIDISFSVLKKPPKFDGIFLTYDYDNIIIIANQYLFNRRRINISSNVMI